MSGTTAGTVGALRIGTRKSPLALVQTQEVVRALQQVGVNPADLEVVPFQTIGDRITDQPLADIGGKGLFSKEIDAALLDEWIDAAVHSAKDLESTLPAGIMIAAALPREDPSDLLITSFADTIETLPKNTVFGTSSVRRAAMLLAKRPDLTIVPFRGNLDTRLQKLAEGRAQATILAAAGINRLGRTVPDASKIPLEVMLPACGQGIVAITCRADDETTANALRQINHRRSLQELECERAVLKVVDGTCCTPIGVFAQLDKTGSTLVVRASLAALDGRRIEHAAGRGGSESMEHLGREIGEKLVRRFPEHAELSETG